VYLILTEKLILEQSLQILDMKETS
jgi:hypothetical protein